jgi:Ca2+-binding EF-hand superfamily protein
VCSTGNGTLELNEFLNIYGIQPVDADWATALGARFIRADADGSGDVSFDEVYDMLPKQVQDKYGLKLRGFFEAVDSNGDEALSPEEERAGDSNRRSSRKRAHGRTHGLKCNLRRAPSSSHSTRC